MKKLFILFFVCIAVSAFAEPAIEWEMDKHFGFDKNEDGRIDIPNTKEYVHPEGYGVSLTLLDGGNSSLYEWTLTDSSGHSVEKITREASVYFEALAQGEWKVVCKTDNSTVSENINVKNYFIACIGDSYASGEGTPEMIYDVDTPSIWADAGPGSAEDIDHIRGHRSSLAWGPQAALFLENYDKHSSVTFVFLAASGATIGEGLIGGYDGVEDPFDLELMPPQVDQLAELADGREIDQLYMSIGGNDVGFVPIATHLVVYEPGKKGGFTEAYQKKLNRLLDSVNRGVFDTPLGVVMGKLTDPLPGLGGIEVEYEKLDKALNEKLKIKDTYLIGYPCPAIPGVIGLDDFAPALGLEIDESESTFIVEKIFKPLEVIKERVCGKYGWNYVKLKIIDFDRHNMSLEAPYNPADYQKSIWDKQPLPWSVFKNTKTVTNFRWFRTATESITVQGAGPHKKEANVFSTCGTIHPNELGYQGIMHELLNAMIIPQGFPDFKFIYEGADSSQVATQ